MSTLVTFLLDRTGSMGSIKDDTIGAFNHYLDELAKGDDIDFTLLQFDSMSLDKTCVAVPIKQAPRLDNQNYQPRASTPLIDAAYKTIKAVEDQVKATPDAKVVICIQTDGQENCSREFTWDQLNALIKEKNALGWQFNFMGASIDAYQQATKMGFTTGQTMSYNAQDTAATKSAFMGRANSTRMFASGMSANTDISSLEKQAAGDKYDPDRNKNQHNGPSPTVPVQPMPTVFTRKPGNSSTFGHPTIQPNLPKTKPVDDFRLKTPE